VFAGDAVCFLCHVLLTKFRRSRAGNAYLAVSARSKETICAFLFLRGQILWSAPPTASRQASMEARPSCSIQQQPQSLGHSLTQAQVLRRSASKVVIQVVMKSCSFFGEIMPCSPLKANRRFGETCRFHMQCKRKKSA
jgi:hypothetical protein